jgi:hypothetical protein
MLRSPVIRVLLLAVLSLAAAAPARAAEPLPFASLSPGDEDAYEATVTEGIPFAITGAPRLSPVHVVVARSPEMADADLVDFFGLSASLTDVGVYRGLSKIGGWAGTPGTYFWQARAFWSAGGSSHAGLGPVRRLVITAPSNATPILERSEGRSSARTHLRGKFRSYRRGRARRIRCARVSRMEIRCRVSWRFRDLRYAGRVEITASSDEVLVTHSRIHRRA